MVTTIPVPIEFSLPEGWRSVPPDEVGAEDAAFVALHPGSSEGFTANITISGELRPSDVALTELADEAIARLRSGSSEVFAGRRSEVGSAENPGLTQAVRLTVEIDGRPRDLVQLQVFLGMRIIEDDSRQSVLHVVFSATPEQFAELIGDFQKFLETIRPEQGEGR